MQDQIKFKTLKIKNALIDFFDNNRIEQFTQNVVKEKDRFSWDKMTKAIFELNSLSNIEKKFFCEFILTYIYKHKKAKQSKIDFPKKINMCRTI